MEVKAIYTLLLIVLAFMLVVATIPQIIKVILGKKIFDTPGGRKIHKNSTPSMGGIGVFMSFIILAMLTVHEFLNFNSNYYYCSLIILFFTGLRDDLIPVKGVYKFIIQIIAAAIVSGFANIRLTSLYSFGFLYAEALPEWLSFFLTIFTIVAFTNAYNLIDGIDGLAASIAVLILGVLTIWFGLNKFWQYSFLCGIMLGAILGFLYYNWFPAKIFMGDTGSLIIGFFCVTMLIMFMNLNEESTYKIDSSITFFISVFVYPAFDIIRVFYIRLKRKRSPFSPDKLHIHLLLKRIGLEHNQITCLIFSTSLACVILFFILNYFKVHELAIFLIISCYCIGLNVFLSSKVVKFKKKKELYDVTKVLKKNFKTKDSLKKIL